MTRMNFFAVAVGTGLTGGKAHVVGSKPLGHMGLWGWMEPAGYREPAGHRGPVEWRGHKGDRGPAGGRGTLRHRVPVGGKIN